MNVAASRHGDAYKAEFWNSIADPPDWIIGNPSYAAAVCIVRHANKNVGPKTDDPPG